MPRPESDCHLLDLAAAEALATTPLGTLRPLRPPTDAAEPFAALDDFDRTLRRSDRLLLETAGTVVLVRSNGETLSQPGTCRGRFVTDLPEGPVKAALADLSPLRSLLAVGAGRLRRETLAFVDDEEKSHCRARLLILDETGGAPAAIVTLHGLRGYSGALADLHTLVLAAGGTALDIDSLQMRLFPDQTVYDAKPSVDLQSEQSAFDAACDIITAYVPVARANEAGIVADHDSEFLHDYRIALRKIRSVLSLFRGVYSAAQTAGLKARFAKLMAPTGRLRDLDVYLLDRRTYYDLLPKSLHGGLDAKFALLAQERKAEKARLARHLGRDPYLQEIAALAALFADRNALNRGPDADLPAHAYACGLIWKRYRRIRRIAALIGPDTDDAEVHGLRIECKKLRYLMEFFAPLFPKEEFRSLLKPLKALQDNLGLVNDCAVQQANLQVFLRGTGKRGKVNLEVAQSVGALTAVLHRRQMDERTRTAASLAQFVSPQSGATFRTLFHPAKDSA